MSPSRSLDRIAAFAIAALIAAPCSATSTCAGGRSRRSGIGPGVTVVRPCSSNVSSAADATPSACDA